MDVNFFIILIIVNFRSCKQNVWHRTPFKIDLNNENTKQVMKGIKGRDKLKREIRKGTLQTKKIDFEQPIFASHNTNSYK